jgi:hypothetical protein
MSKHQSRQIVLIVPDGVLSRSLAFALEADGYHVCAFGSWQSASEKLPTALCVITDQEAFRNGKEARPDFDAYAARMILLTEDAAVAAPAQMQVLVKPLNGADVLSAVDKFIRMDSELRIPT